MSKHTRLTGLLAAAGLLALLLCGCAPEEPAPVTLEDLQQAAYTAMQAGDDAAAGEAVLAAEAQFAGQLDSALYQWLAQRANGDLSQPGARAAYEVLCARGELETDGLILFGRSLMESGELLRARQLLELAARRQNGQEAAELLQGLTVPVGQETEDTAALLRELLAAAAAGDMPALTQQLQSAGWLNAAMPATGFGGRRYSCTAGDGAEGVIYAWLDGSVPVTDLTLTLPDGRACLVRVTPLSAARLCCDSAEGGGTGNGQLEYLNLENGAFLTAEGELRGGLFLGQTVFKTYDFSAAEGEQVCWQPLPEQPNGEYTGEFDENGRPTVRQRGAAGTITVGYDGSGRHYLTLGIPQGMSGEEGVGPYWLPLPKEQEETP